MESNPFLPNNMASGPNPVPNSGPNPGKNPLQNPNPFNNEPVSQPTPQPFSQPNPINLNQTPQSQFQSFEPQPFGMQSGQFAPSQNNDPIILNGGPKKKTNKKTILLLAILLIIGIIAAVVIVPTLLPSENGGPGGSDQGGSDNQSSDTDSKQDNKASFTNPTLREIEDYCVEQKLQYVLQSKPNDGYSYLACTNSSSSGEDVSVTDTVSITAAVYNSSDEEATTNIEKIFSSMSTSLEVIKKDDSYTKYHGGISSTSSVLPAGYTVEADGFLLSVMCGSEELARSILIDLGYPNQDWYDESSEGSSNKEASNDTMVVSQRNTARRNDMSRVDTSLVQYQTNHSNQQINLPEAGKWDSRTQNKGDNTFPDDCTINTACAFIRDYMNGILSGSEAKPNSFEDPNGVTYSMVITPNWATESNIGQAESIGNSQLALVDATNKSYSIKDGESGNAFDEYTIYVVPGGRCVGDAVIASTKRHFAILYRLEGDTIQNYCIDDQ